MLWLLACAADKVVQTVDTPLPPAAPWGAHLWQRLAELETTNLVIVEVDTLRADHLPWYGSARDTFPLLSQRLGSITVAHHYAPTSWTAPSFASLLTGLDTHQHGVRTVPSSDADPDVLIDAPLLYSGLQDLGWSVRLYNGNTVLNRVDLGSVWTQAQTLMVDPENGLSMVEAGLDAIAQPSDKPFLLHLRPTDPHTPWYPAPADQGAFTDGSALPFAFTDGEDQQKALVDAVIAQGDDAATAAMAEAIRGVYDEELLGLDRALDRLFVGLEAAAKLRGTLVVFTADHGETLFDADEGYGHGVLLRPELLHVPLIFFHPDLVEAEVLDDDCVSMTQDLLPTLLPLFDVPAADDAPWADGVPAGAGEGTAGRVLSRDGCRSYALGSIFQRTTMEERYLSWTSPTLEVVAECHGATWAYDLVQDPEAANRQTPSGAAADLLLILTDYAAEIAASDPASDCPISAAVLPE